MLIEEYTFLDDALKEEFILDDGMFFACYTDLNFIFDVYILYDFFVSFCYDIRLNKTTKIILTEFEPNHKVKPRQKNK